jgi:hypothetical protein
MIQAEIMKLLALLFIFITFSIHPIFAQTHQLLSNRMSGLKILLRSNILIRVNVF